MNKILSSILVITTLVCNAVYAETIKLSEKNQTMSDEEFLKKWQEQEQRKKNAKAKLVEIDEKRKALNNLEKTVDDLSKQLQIEKD